MKLYYEKGLLEKKWVEEYCCGNWNKCVRYQMEENDEYHPDWMLPDGSLKKQLIEKE